MTGIQPELWIDRAGAAVSFYEAAFGATVLHRVGDGDDIVAQLAIDDAIFWVAAAEVGRVAAGGAGGAGLGRGAGLGGRAGGSGGAEHGGRPEGAGGAEPGGDAAGLLDAAGLGGGAGAADLGRSEAGRADLGRGRFSPQAIGGATGRTLLVVDDPDALFERAVHAGATPTSPVADEHGWRVGRIVDPFGHEWEIGKPAVPGPPS